MPDSFFDPVEEHYHKWQFSISNKNKSLVPLCKQNYVGSTEWYESSILNLSLESKILMSNLWKPTNFSTKNPCARTVSRYRANNQLFKYPARD